MLDTRTLGFGRVDAGTSFPLNAVTSRLPLFASGMIVNLTATNAHAPGFVTASTGRVPFSADAPPSYSDCNFRPSENVANLTDLKISQAYLNVTSAYASATTDLVLDLQALY